MSNSTKNKSSIARKIAFWAAIAVLAPLAISTFAQTASAVSGYMVASGIDGDECTPGGDGPCPDGAKIVGGGNVS